MKKIILLLFLSFIFGCNKNRKVFEATILKPYIISEEEMKLNEHIDSLKKAGSNIKIMPLKGFYGANNLIIGADENLYYYQRDFFAALCNYGMENDTLPELLNLQPKDLIKIPKESLNLFIDENIMKNEKRKQILIIASQKDTIKDAAFLNFYKKIKVPTYIIRRTTQEEDTVLFYKSTNRYYLPNDINWDEKRIK